MFVYLLRKQKTRVNECIGLQTDKLFYSSVLNKPLNEKCVSNVVYFHFERAEVLKSPPTHTHFMFYALRKHTCGDSSKGW